MLFRTTAPPMLCPCSGSPAIEHSASCIAYHERENNARRKERWIRKKLPRRLPFRRLPIRNSRTGGWNGAPGNWIISPRRSGSPRKRPPRKKPADRRTCVCPICASQRLSSTGNWTRSFPGTGRPCGGREPSRLQPLTEELPDLFPMADHADHQQMAGISRVGDPFGQPQALAHGKCHQRQRQDRPELNAENIRQQPG